MTNDLAELFRARNGHFRLESGHHGELWLELESLFLRPERVAPFARELARRVAQHDVAAICGPLVEGAFVALMVASELGLPFTYSERLTDPLADGLYPVKYRLPNALRDEVRGKRVAIINDVINAGSAVRGTFDDLYACGAEPVALGALLVLGSSAAQFAAAQNLSVEAIASRPNAIWAPQECPLCGRGVPLQDGLALEGDAP